MLFAAQALALCLGHLAEPAALTLGQTPPPPPPSSGEELPPPPPPVPTSASPTPAPNAAPQRMPASEREPIIKALREELTELNEQKSGVGFVFPSICIGLGALAIFGGISTQKANPPWLSTALLIGGTAIATLSTLWLVFRIVRWVSLSNQVSEKEEQLRQLEAQRLQFGLWLGPSGEAWLGATGRF